MLGFASYRSASAASQALASTPAELMLRASEGLFANREPTQSFAWAKRRDGRAATLLFCPNEPDGWIHRQLATDEPVGRLGYASVKRTERTMILSANEANFRKRRQR
jgi:hypothetical protein